MKVTLKLSGPLSDYLPLEARKASQIDLELDPGTTVLGLIERCNLPQKTCKLILIDGNHVQSDACASRQLHDGDVVTIWPAIAGG